MAKKTYTLAVTLGVADPAAGIPEVRDTDGRLVSPATLGLRHIPAGTPIELDEAEGNALLLRHGPYVGPAVAPLVPTITIAPPKR